MSAREPGVHTRISGHTSGNGGSLDAHVEPMGATDLGRTRPEARSVPELIRDLSLESRVLMRQEVQLAKAEMREKIDIYQRGALSMAIGGALLAAALLTGLWALNFGLTALLAQLVPVDVAIWLSPLILTFALAGIGWGMIKGAKERMAREGLAPSRTTQTLRDDKVWAKAKIHEVKEGMTHGR